MNQKWFSNNMYKSNYTVYEEFDFKNDNLVANFYLKLFYYFDVMYKQSGLLMFYKVNTNIKLMIFTFRQLISTKFICKMGRGYWNENYFNLFENYA